MLECVRMPFFSLLLNYAAASPPSYSEATEGLLFDLMLP